MALFNSIPDGFFKYLSGANKYHRLYAECLLAIYDQYEHEISYRIPKTRIRDAVAAYCLENHVESMEDGEIVIHGYNELANNILRKFLSEDVGWLEEDSDDAAYEKHISMTESGLMLAEFLKKLCKPEGTEYTSYIYDIYNTLNNPDQWAKQPYVDGLKKVFYSAKELSKSLKRLSTFMKKIIKAMQGTENLKGLTDSIIEYCDGSFIKEYGRLTDPANNIHTYKAFICSKLNGIQSDEEMMKKLSANCAEEEKISETDAQERILDMLQGTRDFLSGDYDIMMDDIRHKITLYLQIAQGRAKFIKNKNTDTKGNVEQFIRYAVDDCHGIGWKDPIPEDMGSLFALVKNEFLNEKSIRTASKSRALLQSTSATVEAISEEEKEAVRRAYEESIYDPCSREKAKAYISRSMAGKHSVSSDDMQVNDKSTLMLVLAAVSYAGSLGYGVTLEEGYTENGPILLKKFKITEGKDGRV